MLMGYAVAVTTLLTALLSAYVGGYQLNKELSNENAHVRSERDQFRVDLVAAQGERDSARHLRDHWKESSSAWRKQALAQMDRSERLLKQMQERVLPAHDDDADLSDPPTVNEADRRAAEQQRTRTPISVADRHAPPVARAERGDDEEDDDERV